METKEKLYAPFSDIKSRRGKGGTYDYVSWKDVANRMNEVFGTNWSSEVVCHEVVGKDVIVRVRVQVTSPDDFRDRQFQEGYGGATNFEGSEPGNAYKSAYSKALKDACKKWGIGLYLEEDSDSSGNSTPEPLPPGYMGKEYGVPPSNSEGLPTPPGVSMQEAEPKTPPATDTPPTTPYPAPPVEEKPQFPVDEPAVAQHFEQPNTPVSPSVSTGGMPLPPGVAMEVQGETTIKQEEPATPSAPPVPPTNTAPPVPPTVNLSAGEKPMSKAPVINTGEVDKISDVQKAALSSILNIKGVEYESLVKEAFDANGVVKNPIPGPDDLTYQEAVYVVKYGNDKFRRR